MNETQLRTIEQIQQFLDGSVQIEFSPHEDDRERYAHITRVLKRFDYPLRSKRERGVVLAYLRRTSGYSRAQVTRLVAQWSTNGQVAVPAPLAKRYKAPSKPFACKFTDSDIELLVEMDKANENACGSTIAHLLWRAFHQYGDARYQRLATLSVSHLYNLRKSAGYRARRIYQSKTRAVCNPIGKRKKPRPGGRAGFVRIDTVHQGDLDGAKGVYHITCVDCVSQWQVMACVQAIDADSLLPVLQSVIKQFPFEIAGFHSDNGSEYVNHKVATLLSTLNIEQTKSRARRSTDNALAESKNAAVVRKHMGHSYIPQRFAQDIDVFYQDWFNPWLNMHRPCQFASEEQTAKGKIIKRYKPKDVKTPLECLAVLSEQDLVKFKDGVTLQELVKQAGQETDLAAAQQMLMIRDELFERFNRRTA